MPENTAKLVDQSPAVAEVAVLNLHRRRAKLADDRAAVAELAVLNLHRRGRSWLMIWPPSPNSPF